MGTSSIRQIQRQPFTVTRVAAARTHRIALDAGRGDLGAAPAFNRLVDA
jgi:hypothetical protein